MSALDNALQRIAALEEKVANIEVVVGIAPTPDPGATGDMQEGVETEDERRWKEAVYKIMGDYGMAEGDANTALQLLLADHEARGELWTAAVNEIIARDGVSEEEANANLLNLLQRIERGEIPA